MFNSYNEDLNTLPEIGKWILESGTWFAGQYGFHTVLIEWRFNNYKHEMQKNTFLIAYTLQFPE